MLQPVLFLVLCLTGFILFQGANGLTECATPGFYLSSDSNWCFAYSITYKPAPFQSVVCKSYGAELLTIESSAKNELVKTFLTDAGRVSTTKVYMGLTNILGGTSSDWTWYKTPGAIEYVNWETSNPVSTNRYNCAAFSAQLTQTWENDYCLRDKQAICQRPATAADTS